MRIEYDEATDILYLQFKQGQVTTVEVTEQVFVDLDKKGAIAGIEILDASRQVGTDHFGLVKEIHGMNGRGTAKNSPRRVGPAHA